jgi:hypothetical protein
MKQISTSAFHLADITRLVERRQYPEALKILERSENLPAEGLAAKALIYFLQEKYALAAEHYRQALNLEPDHQQWQNMLKQALANQQAAIHEYVPDVWFFTRDMLEGGAEVQPDTFPDIRPKRSPRNGWYWPNQIIGFISGLILTWIVDGVTTIWGKLAGYRDVIWTNWYQRPVFLGVLTLGYMRTRLSKFNLISSYPSGHLVGFLSPDQLTAPPGVRQFRTADGSWNNLQNPLEGAAGTRFMRNIPDYHIKKEKNLMNPNPRDLSLTFLTRKGAMKEVPFLNMLAVAWIQFQNHDWISYGEAVTSEMYEIPLGADDPARKKYWQTKLLVGKTQKDPLRIADDTMPDTYLNECTHWWDGSQIYGSDLKTQKSLRTGKNGKLRIADNGFLYRDRKGIEETGYVRNWWVGLAMMHTLFVREHNAICDHLTQKYPDWDDNRLFQVSRLINAALMAKIHSLEWNAAINPNKALYQGLQSNWYGLLSGILQSPAHKKTVTGIKVRNPEMGGVVGNKTENYGSPYGLTQEFVEVYRLHSMLPEALYIRKIGEEAIFSMPVNETRQAASAKCIDQHGMENLFYSFGRQHPGQLVLNNYPRFMQEMSIPGNPVYDLGAVDILRARERGIPRYNAFRRAMGLHPISRFEDLTTDDHYVRLLKEAYHGDVELIDLMIGALAEEHRPQGFAFGETIFQIFLLNATRRLQADRFYTSCYTAEYYTQEGLDWIDTNTLKTVLLRHYPALNSTGLSNIQNAFEPWDESNQLDPQRHPLRAFDRTLKGDPWRV